MVYTCRWKCARLGHATSKNHAHISDTTFAPLPPALPLHVVYASTAFSSSGNRGMVGVGTGPSARIRGRGCFTRIPELCTVEKRLANPEITPQQRQRGSRPRRSLALAPVGPGTGESARRSFVLIRSSRGERTCPPRYPHQTEVN